MRSDQEPDDNDQRAKADEDERRSYRLCPLAASVTCRTTHDYEPHLIAQGCRRWTCSVCGPRRKAALCRRIVDARPQRMLTLTCRHENDPQTQLRQMARQLPRLLGPLRKSRGPIEYIRFVETCRDGYPHFHLLLRSDYLPQQSIRTRWRELTGAEIVDIRKAAARSVSYVAKYVTKSLAAAGLTNRQRFSVSHHFWRDKDPTETFFDFEHDHEHPTTWAPNRYRAQTPHRIRPQIYHIENREPGDEWPEELLPPTHNDQLGDS